MSSCFIRAPSPECWVNGLQSTEVPPYVLKDAKIGHVVPLINVPRSSEVNNLVNLDDRLRWPENIDKGYRVT